MSNQNSFGAVLRRYRLARALTQEAVAERAGLSVAAVSALERGHRALPRPDTVLRLAEALGLAPEERSGLVAAANATRQVDRVETVVADHPAPAGPESRGISALPIPPTQLLGREREEAEIEHLLRLEGGSRLVTLVGTGGVGKTRLALAVAHGMQHIFSDGAVFVDLSTITDPKLVVSAIAASLHIRESGAQRLSELVESYLASRELLLVLDNLEHLEGVATPVMHLLQACPRLRILGTSRVALELRAEQRFYVPPLELTEAQNGSSDALAGSAAVRLFSARARAVQPDFELLPDNLTTVVEICRRLDGLPLALELAAARTSLLPPAMLLARLDRRLSGLGLAPRDLPARQQTLRATIDWSYDMLSVDEQRVFDRLSVFSGGCTIEAAEAVCASAISGDALDVLGSLVNKSLLVQTDKNGSHRLTMLDTIREYAADHLAASHDAEHAQKAHAEYFLREVEASAGGFLAQQKHWLDQWEREHGNLRTALDWAARRGNGEVGLRIASVVWRMWYLRGYLTEGRARLADLLKRAEAVSSAIVADALRGAAALASQQGDDEAGVAYAEESITLYRSLENNVGAADGLNVLANIAREQSRYEAALAYYDESLRIYRTAGDSIGVAVALNNMGAVARYQGDFEGAVALFEESLALRQAAGDLPGIAWTLHNLGDVARDKGDLERAKGSYEQSLSLRRELGDKYGCARALVALGDVARLDERVAEALASYREGLELSAAIDDTTRVALVLDGLAAIAAPRNHVEHAVRLLARASALRAGNSIQPRPSEMAAHERVRASTREKLSEARFQEAWAAGSALSVERAVAEALAALT